MLVYGDHAERVDPRRRLAELADRTGKWLPHEQLTDLFVDLAGVTQGLADADFEAARKDRLRPLEATLLTYLTTLARTLLRSWDDGLAGGVVAPLPNLPGLPTEVTVKLAEGFAFYAVRPEAYGLAARQLRLAGEARVIGLRSIGTGLACIAAAALGAPPPVTLRPSGEPFDRAPRVAPELAQALLAGDPHFVIVDEGPGLSGSSFGGVADWLEMQGVSPERIAFLPGHGGALGAEAQARHRARWAIAQRPSVALDQPSREWIETLVGPLVAWRDLSGGQWRPLWSASAHDWPAIDPLWERRKFLATTANGKWLVKWAGFGRAAAGKLALAHRLLRWLPETAGLAHGWLVSRWHDEAVPSRPTPGELIAYLSDRRAIAAPQPGASLDELVTMVRRNALPDWAPAIAALTTRPVITDNRLAAHEWLRLPDGRLLKADALDHHQSHDLIGCQDIAWDVAGAIVELDLAPVDAEQLRARLDVAPALLGFMLTAYRAFRLGAHRLSAASLGHWPAERQRHDAAAARLGAALAAVDAVEHAGHVD